MSEQELRDMYVNHPEDWQLAADVESRFEHMSAVKHQAWLDAGQPLNKGGKAPKGMWRKDSWTEGARLFAKTIEGRRLSVPEWEARFEKQIAVEAT